MPNAYPDQYTNLPSRSPIYSHHRLFVEPKYRDIFFGLFRLHLPNHVYSSEFQAMLEGLDEEGRGCLGSYQLLVQVRGCEGVDRW